MKFYVFVSLFVAACVARPDVSHLMNRPSNAYLPSRSGSSDDGDDSFLNINAGEDESQVVEFTSKENVPSSTVLVTDAPTRATQAPQSFEINRQSPVFNENPAEIDRSSSVSTSGADISVSNEPTYTTYSPEIQTTGPTSVVNIESSDQPTGATQTPNIVAINHQPSAFTTAKNIVISSQPTSGTTFRVNIDETNQPAITTQIPQTETETNPSITTYQPVPAPQPDETHITETRFNKPESNIQNIPTGSYLPTSDLVNNIFEGPQSSVGDGNFLSVPGLESVQHIGADQSYKSVYFFAAPDEEESQTRLRINILPSAQASTRVIFIKAPTYAPPVPEIISAASATNDKTLIYVLSKKPDPVVPISVPTDTLIKPTKPQIFFIKYGSQKEVQNAIASGIDEQVVGENVQELLNEQSFINAIMDSNFGADGSTGVRGSGISGGVVGSGTTTAKGIGAGSDTISVTTFKPPKSSKFGPAGDSGPY